VITAPGAKEDSEGTGAILNIVTNDDTEFAGIMGMLSAQAGTNKSPGANIWLTSNVGKVNLSVNGGYFHIDRKMAHNDGYIEQTYTDSGNRLISKSSSEGWGDVGFWGFDGSYELDSLNLFTAEFNGFAQNINGEGLTSSIQTSPDGSPLFSYDTRLTGKPYGRYISFNGGINYQRMTRRKGETITLLYQIANSRNKSDQESTYDNLFNFPAPYHAMIALSDQKFLEQTAQADWARPIFKNGNLSVGGKFIHRNNHATGSNEYISEQSTFRATNFIHTTSISALYADYRHTFGPLSARAGLRYEYSHMKAKFKDGSEPDFSSNLNDWVPNLSVMWNVNDANSLKLSYTCLL
ncbi:MAG: outer membrane beta-barrel family protein, partial [Muribaculaceae bacterium]|nr:outer membrane beta-barrel family protein [Muribaculaceae bacterium]